MVIGRGAGAGEGEGAAWRSFYFGEVQSSMAERGGAGSSSRYVALVLVLSSNECRVSI